MHVKILGSGCKKCETLAANTKEALTELSITAEFTKVSDFNQISNYNVMKTPALVVDDRVLVSGRVPSVAEIKKLLQG